MKSLKISRRIKLEKNPEVSERGLIFSTSDRGKLFAFGYQGLSSRCMKWDCTFTDNRSINKGY